MRKCYCHWIVLILFIITPSCSENVNKKPIGYSELLYVPSKAYNIKYNKIYNHDEVIYDLKENYPAEEFLHDIDKFLKSNGYEPLSYDWLNPDIPSSYVRGWSNFEDATKKPHENVFQWMTEWKNDKEEYVACVMRYKGVIGEQVNSKNAQVVVVYFPDNTAKGLIDWATKENAKNKNNRAP